TPGSSSRTYGTTSSPQGPGGTMHQHGRTGRLARAAARTPQRSRRLALLAALFLVAATLAGPAQAQSGGGEAVIEPGTLSGTVTGPGAEPLEGIWVVIESTRYAWESWWAETDADGAYEIEVPPGYYAVRFSPEPGSSELAAEFYDDTYGTPTPVQVVSGEATTGLD